MSITIDTGFAIVTQPTNQTVGVSNSATFSVTTSPTNGVSYQWLSNGAPISGATLSSYTAGRRAKRRAGKLQLQRGRQQCGQSITSSKRC